jgi:hypothetical protein
MASQLVNFCYLQIGVGGSRWNPLRFLVFAGADLWATFLLPHLATHMGQTRRPAWVRLSVAGGEAMAELQNEGSSIWSCIMVAGSTNSICEYSAGVYCTHGCRHVLYVNMHACFCECVCVKVWVYICVCVCLSVRICVLHLYVHLFVHAGVHVSTHSHVPARIYARVHACMHMHACMHVCVWARGALPPCKSSSGNGRSQCPSRLAGTIVPPRGARQSTGHNMLIRLPWLVGGVWCEHSCAIHWPLSAFVGLWHSPSHEVVVTSR